MKTFISWVLNVWVILGFLVAVGLAISRWIAKHDFGSSTNSVLDSKPQLKLQRIELAKNINIVAINAQGVQTIIGNPHFLRIWISNEPEKPELGVDAENVHAEIQFFDLIKRPLLRIDGRWPEAGQPAGSLVSQQMTIPPNRKPFCLDIAMKYLDEEEMYGYDDLASKLEGGRNPNTKLRTGLFFVRVILACKGLNENFWFQLENSGKGKDPSLKPLPQFRPTAEMLKFEYD